MSEISLLSQKTIVFVTCAGYEKIPWEANAPAMPNCSVYLFYSQLKNKSSALLNESRKNIKCLASVPFIWSVQIPFFIDYYLQTKRHCSLEFQFCVIPGSAQKKMRFHNPGERERTIKQNCGFSFIFRRRNILLRFSFHPSEIEIVLFCSWCAI